MANTCYVTIHAIGSHTNIEEFINILQKREESSMILIDYQIEEIKDLNGKSVCCVKGEAWCRWSFYSANCIKEMQIITKRYSIAAEFFTSEEGIGFQEHYLIIRGEVEIDDCVDFFVTCDSGELEENEIENYHYEGGYNTSIENDTILLDYPWEIDFYKNDFLKFLK